MFRTDQGTMPHAPAVCLVAPLTDDGKTRELASRLTEAGCRVHVLGLNQLADTVLPAAWSVSGPHLTSFLQLSDQVRVVLSELHRVHRFDLVDFIDDARVAFRTVQAKKTGLDFADVALLVHCEESGEHKRQREQRWLDDPDEVAQDYCERYVLDNADCHMEPTTELGALANRYRELLSNKASMTALANFPLVTVSVAYYNLAAYLPEALASLAVQTYPSLEVIVINDGSTDAEAIRVLDEMRTRYAQFRFIDQENAGIGATRNRGLELARGEFFLPMDADNVARPDMVARFAEGLQSNPELAALASYFLAFEARTDLESARFLYAFKPTGGPRVLGCLRNVYGDGNALFRTNALQAVGGFTTDRDASWEDWEVFVKLVNAGFSVDVVPDFLFYYRHRDAGFSRSTDAYRNRQRVLRQYVEIERLSPAERSTLWNLLTGMHLRLEKVEDDKRTLAVLLRSKRYQIMDRLNAVLKYVPGFRPTMRWLWNRWNKRQGSSMKSSRRLEDSPAGPN